MMALQVLGALFPRSDYLSRRSALGAVGSALAAPLVGLPASSRAQPRTDWPSQPVRYINPFPPGGATDTLSRLWCAKMSDWGIHLTGVTTPPRSVLPRALQAWRMPASRRRLGPFGLGAFRQRKVPVAHGGMGDGEL